MTTFLGRRIAGLLIPPLMMGAASFASDEALPFSAAARIAQELQSGQHPGFESFQFSVDGQLLARYVDPRLDKRPPDLRSATKSVTALLIGIAIDRGELPSVEAKAIDYLPAHRASLEKDPRKASISVRDLLTMRSGLDCDDWNPKSPGHEDKMYRRRDWLAFWSAQDMARSPGGAFSYCTGNVIALGVILATATGKPADVYAAEQLFGPLGVREAQWERWDRDRQIDTGGHLRLRPDDFARIGALLLSNGRVGDRQVVSADWIKAMTTAQVSVRGESQQYGYLWWISRTVSPSLPKTDLWWAQGNGGTLLVVMPQLRAVMTTTGTRFNRPEALEPLTWLRDRLLPELLTTAE